jgi:hypothetical protein
MLWSCVFILYLSCVYSMQKRDKLIIFFTRQRKQGQTMLRDYRKEARRRAAELRRDAEAVENYGTYVLNLAPWSWLVTITFRWRTSPECGFRALQKYFREMKDAAGGSIAWAAAAGVGTMTSRVHFHALIAGVGKLDQQAWARAAERQFGRAEFEAFDRERGGAHYVAKNGLHVRGDIRFGGRMFNPALRSPEVWK